MYQKKNSVILKHIDFVVLDLVMLELSFLLASGIYYGFERYFNVRYRNLMICILLLAQLVVVTITKAYHDIIRRGYLIECKKVIIQDCLVMGTVFSILFIARMQTQYSRGVLLLT